MASSSQLCQEFALRLHHQEPVDDKEQVIVNKASVWVGNDVSECFRLMLD